MILQDMIVAINDLVDDVVPPNSCVRWLNQAKDDMATSIEAKFPDLVATNPNDTFVFDTKFHEIPILYACARYKEKDVMTQEADRFQAQYEDKKKWFMLLYDVPPQYKDDPFSQQFTASAGQTQFAITKNSYIYGVTSPIQVYYNNLIQPSTSVQVNSDNSFIFTKPDGTPLVNGDLVTVTWPEDSGILAPYPWMQTW